MGSWLPSLPTPVILGCLGWQFWDIWDGSAPRNSRAGGEWGSKGSIPGLIPAWNSGSRKAPGDGLGSFPLPRCHFVSPRLSPAPAARNKPGKSLIPTFPGRRWADSRISSPGGWRRWDRCSKGWRDTGDTPEVPGGTRGHGTVRTRPPLRETRKGHESDTRAGSGQGHPCCAGRDTMVT